MEKLRLCNIGWAQVHLGVEALLLELVLLLLLLPLRERRRRRLEPVHEWRFERHIETQVILLEGCGVVTACKIDTISVTAFVTVDLGLEAIFQDPAVGFESISGFQGGNTHGIKHGHARWEPKVVRGKLCVVDWEGINLPVELEHVFEAERGEVVFGGRWHPVLGHGGAVLHHG